MATLQEIIALRNQTNQPLQQLGSAVADIYGTYKRNQRQDQGEANKLQAIRLLKQSSEAQTPEESEALFMQAYSIAPELIKGFTSAQKARREAMGQGAEAKPFQQADSGLVFDPNTGTYSIDETAKALFAKKAEEKAAQGVKLGVKDIQGINKDVTGLIKDTVGISSAASSLDNLKASSSPTAQLAAIFKFMKALDPTSVVREGEQDMARKTGGPADYLVGYVNDIQGKGGLTPEVFTDMVNTSKNLANSAISTTQTEIESYLDVFGDTIPEDFKAKVKSRIPATMGSSEQVNSDISEMSDDDLKKSLGL